MSGLIDLVGKTFGEWIVIARDTTKQSGKVQWISQCSCGTIKSVLGTNLRTGKSNNCGHSRGVTHGLSDTRLHCIWRDMKRRCSNPNCNDFSLYMGRGIKVCQEWKESFEAFQHWATLNGYEDHLTIERIENDDGYSPDNCRWATIKEQNNNKRNNFYIEINGRSQTLAQWSNETGIPWHTLRARFIKGDRENKLFRPVELRYTRKKVI